MPSHVGVVACCGAGGGLVGFLTTAGRRAVLHSSSTNWVSGGPWSSHEGNMEPLSESCKLASWSLGGRGVTWITFHPLGELLDPTDLIELPQGVGLCMLIIINGSQYFRQKCFQHLVTPSVAIGKVNFELRYDLIIINHSLQLLFLLSAVQALIEASLIQLRRVLLAT